MFDIRITLPIIFYLFLGWGIQNTLQVQYHGFSRALLLGYSFSNLLFMAVFASTRSGWTAWWVLASAAFLVISLGVWRIIGKKQWKNSFENWKWKDLVVFLVVMVINTWPFLIRPTPAPWGNSFLDVFNFAYQNISIIHWPNQSTVPTYFLTNTWMNDYFPAGEFIASALFYLMAGRPEALLGVHWHISFLLALFSLMMKELAHEVFHFDSWVSYCVGITVACSTLLSLSIYSGHTGSSIFLPLYLGILLLIWKNCWNWFNVILLFSFATLIILCYAYPLAIFLPGTLLFCGIRSLHFYGSAKKVLHNKGSFLFYSRFLMGLCTKMNDWQRRLTPRRFNQLISTGVILFGIVCLFIAWQWIYEWGSPYRDLARIRVRNMPEALMAQFMIPYWGLQPRIQVMHYVVPKWFINDLWGGIIALLLWILSFSGIFYLTSKRRRMLLGYILLVLLAFGLVFRYALEDCYVLYKIYYLGLPFAFLGLTSSLYRLSSWLGGQKLRSIITILALGGISVCNICATQVNVREILRQPYNSLYSQWSKDWEKLQELFSPIYFSESRRDWITILHYAALEKSLNKITPQHPLYPFYGDRSSRFSYHEKPFSQIKYQPKDNTPQNSANREHWISFVDFPEILRFQGLSAPLVFHGTSFSLASMNKEPSIYAIGDDGGPWGIDRHPSFWNFESFRWMFRRISFRVRRWPVQYTRIRFNASPEIATTSGRFHLRVWFNSHCIFDQIIESRNTAPVEYWATIDSKWILENNELVFEGEPLPGPPLNDPRRNFSSASLTCIEVLSSDTTIAPINPVYNRIGGDITKIQELDIDRHDNILALGPGWEQLEHHQGKKSRWILEDPAVIRIIKRQPDKRKLVLKAVRGPGLSPQAILQVKYREKVLTLNISQQIVLDLDRDSLPEEVVTLSVIPENSPQGSELRKLALNIYDIWLE